MVESTAGCGEAAALRRALCAWFERPLGRSLQAAEVNRLRSVLPGLFGAVAVQLGAIGRLDMLDGSPIATRVVYDLLAGPSGACVRGLPEALPFDGRSVDLLVLPHTLDFVEDPHQVLREAERVLVPEGHLVILGFNPFSLWGLRRLFARRPRPVPWCGHFLSLSRIKDWLALLDFQLTHGSMHYYRLPLNREAMIDRMFFLDKMGDRWWPMMAAVYLVVARKRVPGMTPLPVRRRTQPVILPGAGEPVARGLRRHG